MPNLAIETTVDVTRAVPELPGPLSLAATIHAPARLAPDRVVPVIFAVPGGGYARRYFSLEIPGRAGYSEADHHAARGRVMVTVDHLGVGESTVPDLSHLTLRMMARAYAAAVDEIVARLKEGRIAAALPPLPRVLRVGMGQSMGGAISVLTQGLHASFDAIAPLGYGILHTTLPQPSDEAYQRTRAAFEAYGGRPPEEISIEESSSHVPDFRYPFHWEDVPADIVDADMGSGYPLRAVCPPWGSPTTPSCAPSLMARGALLEEAARVTVPVFVGQGERDTAASPRDEAAAYPNSRDVTVFIVPRMAHMHNFAGTRRRLWERFGGWVDDQARGLAAE